MITHNTKLRLILFLTAVLLLSGFLILDFLNIRAENAETARLILAAGQNKEKEVLIHSIRAFQESAAPELQALSDMTLTPATLVTLIESLENAGRALGLKTEIVSVNKSEESSGDSQMVTITVESSGSWQGNFSFLKAVESLPHRVVIKQAHLSKSDEGWRSAITLSLNSFAQ